MHYTWSLSVRLGVWGCLEKRGRDPRADCRTPVQLHDTGCLLFRPPQVYRKKRLDRVLQVLLAGGALALVAKVVTIVGRWLWSRLSATLAAGGVA